MFSRKLDNDAPVKDPATYKIVGKSVPRLDIRDKATGRFTYMHQSGTLVQALSSRTRRFPYKLPNVKTVCHRLETTPLRPS